MTTSLDYLCRWLLLSVLLLAPLAGACAQAPLPDTATYNRAGSVLWRITGPGQSQPSYVLGTMHVLCPEDAAIRPEMAAAFDATQQLVLELDMDAPDFNRKMRRNSTLRGGISLRTMTKQREFRTIREFFKERLHQSVLAVVLLPPALTESFVYSSTLPCTPVSYEGLLVERARAAHKETLGLETVEEQFESIKRIPYDVQVKGLLEAIRTYDSIPALMQQLVGTYRRQNVEELYRISIDPRFNTESDGGAAELAQRNANWIPKMKEWMASRPSFFAVGAAHLGGRTGVLQLLRAQGYQVEPVWVTKERQ